MHLATGTALVLVTWCFAILVIAAIGLPLALAAEGGRVSSRTVARGLWWGLLAVASLAALLAAVIPLRSPTAAGLLGLVVVAAVPVAGWTCRGRGWAGGLKWTLEAGVGIAGVVIALAVFAVSAMGPVTNYDTGLYHLGAIRYAMDHVTIPGLANLYGPLGYGNAEFTLAALLGNSPLGVEGYRVLNGLVIVLACADLVIRLLTRRWSAGTWVLLVGMTVALTPMLLLADYWVTSPSQDAPVLFVTVVASSYLVDALSARHRWGPDAAAALALAILLVLLRPTMGVFACTVLVVLLVRLWHGRTDHPTGLVMGTAAVVAGIGILAAAATTVRDYLLSGWLLYPLSILPFDVAWRAADPVGLREATLGFWRNPDDIWGSVEGWDWVGPWLGGLAGQWESVLLALLLLGTAIALVVAARAGTVRWRRLVLAVAPSVAASAAWLVVSPPGFRFGWGPLFTLLAIPLGWALWRLTAARPAAAGSLRRASTGGMVLLLVAASVVAVVRETDWRAFSTEASGGAGPLSVTFVVAPVPEPPITEVQTGSGLTLLVPSETDQCWTAYPLCTPSPSLSLRPRGSEWPDGLLP